MDSFIESRIEYITCAVDSKGKSAQLYYDNQYIAKAYKDGTIELVDDLPGFDESSLKATISANKKSVMFFNRETHQHAGTVYPKELSKEKSGLLAKVASLL